MPIYEYRCNSCGAEKEHIQKIHDAPLTICPVCGSSNYTKRISAAGFQLKGSGWYVTDFRNTKTESTDTKSITKENAQPSAANSDKATVKHDNSSTSTTATD